MTLTTKYPELEQYALDNYKQGGHWVYETHGNEDYQEVLEYCGDDIEKAGEKMSNQVETAMDEMVSLLGKFVDFLRNEQRTGQAKLPQNISTLLDKVKKATLLPTSSQALGDIEDAIQEVDDFYNKKSEEPVQEGYFYKKYIKKGK